MNMKKNYIAIWMSFAFMLSGCMSFFGDEPEVKQIPIQQAPNPTTLDVAVIASGIKTPIAVHFFELETDEYFKRLDYFELMRKKKSKLDGDIVKHSKKILNPLQMEKFYIRPEAKTRYYAIVVGFKDVKSNDKWRFIQEIIPERKNDITLILNQNSMKKIHKLPKNDFDNPASSDKSSSIQLDTDKIIKNARDTVAKKASDSLGKIFK